MRSGGRGQGETCCWSIKENKKMARKTGPKSPSRVPAGKVRDHSKTKKTKWGGGKKNERSLKKKGWKKLSSEKAFKLRRLREQSQKKGHALGNTAEKIVWDKKNPSKKKGARKRIKQPEHFGMKKEPPKNQPRGDEESKRQQRGGKR